MRAILDEASSPPKPKPQENEPDFPVKEDDKDLPEPLHEFPDKRAKTRMVAPRHEWSKIKGVFCKPLGGTRVGTNANSPSMIGMQRGAACP